MDLNGDGDTLDTVIVARGSVTRTSAPRCDDRAQHLVVTTRSVPASGSSADHRQTQPAVPVDNERQRARHLAAERSDPAPRRHRHKAATGNHQQWPASSISATAELPVRQGYLHFRRFAPRASRNLMSNANETFTTGYRPCAPLQRLLLPQAGVRVNLDKAHQVFANLGKTSVRCPTSRSPATTSAFVGTDAIAARGPAGDLR